MARPAKIPADDSGDPKRVLGFPNTATAAIRPARSGASGGADPREPIRCPTGGTPASMETTAAPWENPPRANRVFGQLAADTGDMARRVIGTRGRVQKVDPGRIVDPVGRQGAPAEQWRQSIGQRLTHPADADRLTGAAGEDQLHIGAPVGGRRRSHREGAGEGDGQRRPTGVTTQHIEGHRPRFYRGPR